MLSWLKNRLFPKATDDAADEAPVAVEESFSPVGVRVKPTGAVQLKPADTYIAGYNVDEGGGSADDEHSATVNDIKTTGVDPYNTGRFDHPDAAKALPEK